MILKICIRNFKAIKRTRLKRSKNFIEYVREMEALISWHMVLCLEQWRYCDMERKYIAKVVVSWFVFPWQLHKNQKMQ